MRIDEQMEIRKLEPPSREGKTKIIHSTDQSGLVIVGNKDNITAFDDPRFTRKVPRKGEYCTTTTVNCFELLRRAGFPVACFGSFSPTEFIAWDCEMIPLEVVCRRYPWGSFLKRHEELKGAALEPQKRLIREFFLKTTNRQLTIGEKVVVGNLPLDDPFIANPLDRLWYLFDPKKSVFDTDAQLEVPPLDSTKVLSPLIPAGKILNLAGEGFVVLEQALGRVGFILVDIKFEFGIDGEGNLRFADGITGDEWRLWHKGEPGKDVFSKEVFRQLVKKNPDDPLTEELGKIADDYSRIAEFTSRPVFFGS
jgi:phosphoribosylaminoimidazole-succinocarboxamide synthase